MRMRADTTWRWMIAGALACVVAVCAGTIAARGDGPYRWPLGVATGLTGTLGEWRAVHLHQGIDISTLTRNGLPVLAAGDGRLVRLMSWRRGYGNALILDHGGGILTLYGHLGGFEESRHGLGALVPVVKALYNADDITLDFSGREHRYRRGERIADSGESGSGVSHLHFEFRDGRGTPNPLALMPVRDADAPIITDVFVCALAGGALAYERRYRVTRENGRHVLETDIIPLPRDGAAFLKVACHDRLGVDNRIAVYRLELFVDDASRYALVFDHVGWGDHRHAIDLYDTSKLRLDGATSYVYPLANRFGAGYAGLAMINGGFLPSGGSVMRVRIVARDFAGNAAELAFSVRRDDALAIDTAGRTFADRARGATVRDPDGGCDIRVGAGGLRTNAWLAVRPIRDASIRHGVAARLGIGAAGIVRLFSVAHDDAVCAQPAVVSLKRPPEVSDAGSGRYVVCSWYDGGLPRSHPTRYDPRADAFVAQTKTLGMLALVRDDAPPDVVLPPTHELFEDRDGARFVRVCLADRISGLDHGSIVCLVDGEPLAVSYDRDRMWIEIELPREHLARGVHHLLVRCRDRAGNEGILRSLVAF